MSGSLVLIDSATASNSSTVSLGGSDWDSSYDVYMVIYDKIICDTDQKNFQIRVLKSSSADTTSNYDQAYKKFDSTTSAGDRSATSQAYWETEELGTATQEQNNGVVYLFNFNDGSQNFNSNFSLKTRSIEVVVRKLLENGIQQKEHNKFLNK